MRHWSLKILFLLFIILVDATLVSAQSFILENPNHKGRVYLVASYLDHANPGLKVSMSTPSPEKTIEIGVRLIRIFNLAALYSKLDDKSLETYGLGMRVNTPGFFFLFSSIDDLEQKGRHHRLNTSLFAMLAYDKYSAINNVQDSFENVLGASIDVFVFGPLFMSISGYNRSILSSNYFTYGGGMGVEF